MYDKLELTHITNNTEPKSKPVDETDVDNSEDSDNSVYSNGSDSSVNKLNLDTEFTKNELKKHETTVTEESEEKKNLELKVENQQVIDNKYYSMIKPELLINDIIDYPQYTASRTLLLKIQSGKIDEITRAEADNFTLYLQMQISNLNSLMVTKIKKKFILILYIMLYSKYHLSHNFRYYQWEGSKIIIHSWKNLNIITKYYFRFNEDTFTKYIGWINFVNSSPVRDRKVFTCTHFTNNMADLISLDFIFNTKMHTRTNKIQEPNTTQEPNSSNITKRKLDNQSPNSALAENAVKRTKLVNLNDSTDLFEQKLDELITNAFELIKSNKKLEDLACYELLQNRLSRKINPILEKQVIISIRTNLSPNKKN